MIRERAFCTEADESHTTIFRRDGLTIFRRDDGLTLFRHLELNLLELTEADELNVHSCHSG